MMLLRFIVAIHNFLQAFMDQYSTVIHLCTPTHLSAVKLSAVTMFLVPPMLYRISSQADIVDQISEVDHHLREYAPCSTFSEHSEQLNGIKSLHSDCSTLLEDPESGVCCFCFYSFLALPVQLNSVDLSALFVKAAFHRHFHSGICIPCSC